LLSLLGGLDLESLLALLEHDLGLETHDSSAPLALSITELGGEVILECLELGLVTLLDVGQGNNGGGLLVGQSTEASLALNDGEGDSKLAAESGKPNNELDGVNIVSDDDQLGFLLLNQSGDVLQTELEDGGGLRGLLVTSSGGLQALLLGGGGLRQVVIQELEERSGLVLVEGSVELVDHGGDLQSLKEDLLLSLESDVLGPTNVSRQVATFRLQ
jgi:hypothetical protein